ncbi:hypothetical protein V1478_012188 [Vespula squamosa]|uniref:Uncharacterized protein n=1 Tax=Vespula squamosa TaxID=30214 RepID=A0ABD2ADA5_VESSQ
MPHTVSRSYRFGFSHESARSEEYAKKEEEEEEDRHGSRTRWTRRGREMSSLNGAPRSLRRPTLHMAYLRKTDGHARSQQQQQQQ